MPNDFEMVRDYIQRADRTFGGAPGPRAALDRIEAEVERLREQHDRDVVEVVNARDEVERLRAEKKNVTEAFERQTQQKANMQAEVERLQAENFDLKASVHPSVVGVLEAEVERLNTRLVSAETYRDAARDEVKRLRASRNAAVDELLVQGREVERLRAALEQIAEPEQTTHVQAVAIARAALAKEEVSA